MQSDSELVNAVLNGERAAFATLLRRYQRPARAVALDVLADYHRAQDATQDAFVRAYQSLPSLRRPAAFGPWLLKITRRCALDIARRGPNEQPLEPTLAGAIQSRDGQLDEQKQRLLATVMRLPEAEKQVVMLRYFAGHRVKDVAEILGRGVGTVTKQLSRAHRRLRKTLKD